MSTPPPLKVAVTLITQARVQFQKQGKKLPAHVEDYAYFISLRTARETPESTISETLQTTLKDQFIDRLPFRVGPKPEPVADTDYYLPSAEVADAMIQAGVLEKDGEDDRLIRNYLKRQVYKLNPGIERE